MKTINKYFFQLIGVVIGTIGGFLYYRFIGCQSGSCAITSNPYMSMIWGGLMGYLLLDMLAGYLKSGKESGKN